jgi:hypothetical protein
MDKIEIVRYLLTLPSLVIDPKEIKIWRSFGMNWLTGFASHSPMVWKALADIYLYDYRFVASLFYHRKVSL